jgi:hypothetical protein
MEQHESCPLRLMIGRGGYVQPRLTYRAYPEKRSVTAKAPQLHLIQKLEVANIYGAPQMSEVFLCSNCLLKYRMKMH